MLQPRPPPRRVKLAAISDGLRSEGESLLYRRPNREKVGPILSLLTSQMSETDSFSSEGSTSPLALRDMSADMYISSGASTPVHVVIAGTAAASAPVAAAPAKLRAGNSYESDNAKGGDGQIACALRARLTRLAALQTASEGASGRAVHSSQWTSRAATTRPAVAAVTAAVYASSSPAGRAPCFGRQEAGVILLGLLAVLLCVACFGDGPSTPPEPPSAIAVSVAPNDDRAGGGKLLLAAVVRGGGAMLPAVRACVHEWPRRLRRGLMHGLRVRLDQDEAIMLGWA